LEIVSASACKSSFARKDYPNYFVSHIGDSSYHCSMCIKAFAREYFLENNSNNTGK
jgi:hypothetical protein